MATYTTHYNLKKPEPSDTSEIITDLNSNYDSIDTYLYQKANKVSTPTENNLAGLTATGDLKDSGKKASDFGQKAVNEAITGTWSFYSSQSSAPLGDNLVTNGTFDSSLVGWTATGWTWDNGTAKHTTGNANPLQQTISVTSGKTYQIEFTMMDRTTGNITVDINGVYIYNEGMNTTFSASAIKTFTADTTGSVNLSFTPTNDFNGSLDNIIIREIIGNSIPQQKYYDDSNELAGELRCDFEKLNLSLGISTGYSNTTGDQNTFIGSNAGYSNTTGDQNTFIGSYAGRDNTTGVRNTFIGSYAGRDNTTGSYNIFIGRYTGCSNDLGSYNLFVGGSAGYLNTTGYYNTFIGSNAGYSNTTGYYNTFIGRNAGYHGSQKPDAINSIAIGYGTYTTANNQIQMGNDSITEAKIKVAWTITSDDRMKTNIQPSNLGLDFIKELQPISYQFKKQPIEEEIYNENGKLEKTIPINNTPDGITRLGFSAQDVLTIESKYYKDPIIVNASDPDRLGIIYDEFIPVLVKAIQEQQVQIEELQKQLGEII